jgi:subtilisin family serine protease
MATPHASGVAALVWSVNRNLTNEEVRQVIEDTCDDIDAANPGFVGMLGRGRVNAFQAVSRATGAISMSGALSQLLEPNKDISGALSSVLE